MAENSKTFIGNPACYHAAIQGVMLPTSKATKSTRQQKENLSRDSCNIATNRCCSKRTRTPQRGDKGVAMYACQHGCLASRVKRRADDGDKHLTCGVLCAFYWQFRIEWKKAQQTFKTQQTSTTKECMHDLTHTHSLVRSNSRKKEKRGSHE